MMFPPTHPHTDICIHTPTQLAAEIAPETLPSPLTPPRDSTEKKGGKRSNTRSSKARSRPRSVGGSSRAYGGKESGEGAEGGMGLEGLVERDCSALGQQSFERFCSGVGSAMLRWRQPHLLLLYLEIHRRDPAGVHAFTTSFVLLNSL